MSDRIYTIQAREVVPGMNGQFIADDFHGCHPAVREELRAAFCEPPESRQYADE